MHTSQNIPEQAIVAAREIQQCIEATQQQIAAARHDVLQLIEQQWGESALSPSPPSPVVDQALDGQDACVPTGQPTGQSRPNAQAQLAKVIHLMIQRSGRYAVESTTASPSLAEDTTEAAIKIFDEVAQIFKEMSEPLLQQPLTLQVEPQDLNEGAIDEGTIDVIPLEDVEVPSSDF